MNTTLATLATAHATSSTTDGTLGVVGAALLVGLLLAYALLVLGALISALGSPLTGGMKLVWIIFVFIAPFIGSICWFLAGKRNAYASPYLRR
ncbi:PLD nuclease N-terminal domain-containing protein [Kribbella sp. NPDC051620]|uniref:PLD nuclease N-terminal domain-containing protein n=1 Tax=Kribbella sp. NPDC051620 TaxID=3364120 RepID=UPI003789B8E7